MEVWERDGTGRILFCRQPASRGLGYIVENPLLAALAERLRERAVTMRHGVGLQSAAHGSGMGSCSWTTAARLPANC